MSYKRRLCGGDYHVFRDIRCCLVAVYHCPLSDNQRRHAREVAANHLTVQEVMGLTDDKTPGWCSMLYVCSILYALCSMLYFLSSMLYALCFMPYTLYYILYTLYSIRYTLYSILYTLYSIVYTVYSIPFTLYSILYTLYSIHFIFNEFSAYRISEQINVCANSL